MDTPVWFVKQNVGSGFYVLANIKSGKVKRLQNFNTARVAICDWRGRLKGERQPAFAELVAESKDIIRLFRCKYGLVFYTFEFFSWLSKKRRQRQMILLTLDNQ